MNDKRSYVFGGVLYPDSVSYDCESVLALICETGEKWAYILHDRDVSETGEFKKGHIHWFCRFADAKTISSVAKKFGLEEHDIELVKNQKAYLRYLVHADHPEKYQYEYDAVSCSDNINYGKVLGIKSTEDVTAKAIFEHIRNSHITRTTELAAWAFENECWSEFRRSYAIWAVIMRENELRDSKIRKEGLMNV